MCLTVSAMLGGCIDPYTPEVQRQPGRLLVVDGAINSKGISVVRLSYAMAVSQKGNPVPETKARVFIEEAEGARYPLSETSVGTYTSAALQLAAGKQVRLHFTTATQRDYISDYTTVKDTPPIDSISWAIRNRKLNVYANTHDASNLSQYFRWTYVETWEFTSAFQSVIEYKSGSIVPRRDDVYHCWGTEAPSTIVLGSTTRLAQNRVSEQVISQLPDASPKVRIQYSILVKQYALTPEEYAYWEQMRKNTESIGSLFDALPSQLTGNVHCQTEPAEQVLGFVGAQSVEEKRIFIERQQLPADWPYVTGYEGCFLDTIPRKNQQAPPLVSILEFFRAGNAVPVTYGGGYICFLPLIV
ncbi:DUF4249 domain-containing protein [Hymenobacter sp. BT728]|nr:DUF4249 domain-containing protein [Hymenobacter pini]